MDGEMRRKRILQLLSEQTKPLSGTALAKQFGVSRQVIVQDIALLKSKEPAIISTYRGYVPVSYTHLGIGTSAQGSTAFTKIRRQGLVPSDSKWRIPQRTQTGIQHRICARCIGGDRQYHQMPGKLCMCGSAAARCRFLLLSKYRQSRRQHRPQPLRYRGIYCQERNGLPLRNCAQPHSGTQRQNKGQYKRRTMRKGRLLAAFFIDR